MQTAPIPANEKERLESLYKLEILDTLPEERFDRITRLATRLFKVPISTLSLIDSNREWFKSCQGLNQRQNDRAISFCAQAMLSSNIFIIPDALKDDRFADNPMVTGEPYIRFYAGVALFGPDRQRVGTFCIKDRQSRNLSDEEITNLKDLAAWAELELNTHELGRALTALEEAKIKDEAFLGSIGEGVVVTDFAGKVILINQVVSRIVGYGQKEIIGKIWAKELPRVEDGQGKRVIYEQTPVYMALHNQGTFSKKLWYVNARGETVPVVVTGSPVIIKGQNQGAIVIFRDITKEEELDKAKSEFISLASHQLRTPLGIIKWYIEALKENDLIHRNPQMVQDYLDEVYNSNERLIKLVGDLLDVSHIVQSKVKNEMVATDVLEFIKTILKQLEVEAKKKGIKIILLDKLKNLPKLNIDQEKFREVFENLVSNSIKYTDQSGQVEITVGNDKSKFQVDIKDNGMGISKEDQPKIFTRFFRAAEAAKKDTNGSGLGLYIVKSYIEDWDGKIWFESQSGKGTIFHFSLPLKIKS